MTSKPAPVPTAPEALGRVLLPLRAFLGFTFCFAGVQRLPGQYPQQVAESLLARAPDAGPMSGP